MRRKIFVTDGRMDGTKTVTPSFSKWGLLCQTWAICFTDPQLYDDILDITHHGNAFSPLFTEPGSHKFTDNNNQDRLLDNVLFPEFIPYFTLAHLVQLPFPKQALVFTCFQLQVFRKYHAKRRNCS